MENDPFIHREHPAQSLTNTPFKWMLYILVSAIPLIGLIMLFIWGFGNDPNVSRRNWAKGMLLFYVFLIVLYIVFALLFGAALLAATAGN